MKTFNVLIIVAFLALFVLSGCEDYDIEAEKFNKKKESDDDYQLSPEELELQRQFEERRNKMKQLQSRDGVMAVVNKFFSAIENDDQEAFFSCMNLEKMLTYYVERKKNFTMEDFREYLSVEEAHKVFAFYNWTMDPKWSKVFYADEIRGDPNVGYVSYILTPKPEYKEKYDSKKFNLTMKLKINPDELKWEIVNMNFPREFNLLKYVTVTIEGETHWEVWRYRLPLEEYVKFMRNHKSDENYYVPPDQYKVRWLKTLQPLEEDRPEIENANDPFTGVTIPELISNIDLDGKQESIISQIRSGLVGSWRDVDVRRDMDRGFVGALINLIILSAQDHFNDRDMRNAAIEANKALQKLYAKDKGPERVKYTFSVGELSTMEDKADSVDIIYWWIELFEKSGWEK